MTAAQDFAAHSVQRQPGDDVAADIQSGSDFPVPTSHLSLVSTSPGFPSKGSSQFPFASTSKEAARPTDNTNSNDGVSESAKRACTNAELEGTQTRTIPHGARQCALRDSRCSDMREHLPITGCKTAFVGMCHVCCVAQQPLTN